MRLKTTSALLSAIAVLVSLPTQAFGESSIRLRPEIQLNETSLTLVGAVHLAESRYPQILKQQAELRAAKRNVTLQKVREYNPAALLSYQQADASHNRLTQTLFGSAVLPATPGPGPENVKFGADAFSAAGFIIDWAPIDFGLHKARINYSKAEMQLASAHYDLTVLDVTVQAAASFLDALIMKEQVGVAIANVQRFADFSKVVHAQVDAGLKAGADASLADSQLANAKNDLVRARLNYELALAELAFKVGVGGNSVEINPGGISKLTQPDDPQRDSPKFTSHPLTLAKQSIVNLRQANRKVLEKEYYPKFRWLAGINLRGTTFKTNKGDVPAPGISGLFPTVPNWNVGMVIDFPFFEIIRIQAEKKVVDEQIDSAQQSYALAVQQLKTEDVQARARVKASLELAANMPIQVQAATQAAQQAQARYEAGLATVAQVAEANQILADSRVKEAVTNVGVWKALLANAAVHGNLRPFLGAASQATGSNDNTNKTGTE
ncbi:MAG: TolC family protein [Candidatus Obscuribacterales bacterium]